VSKLLIVNADDFGLTPGVNAGIVDAHRDGILTSASMFANAAATEDAIRSSRTCPQLGIGCHLTLVDGAPVLPAPRVRTLVGADGRFRQTWMSFMQAATTGAVSLREVEAELTAQIEKLRSSGIRLTHLDGHKHVHLYPPVFGIVAALAARFQIPSVRIPFETPAIDLVRRHWRSGAAARQAWENLAFAMWARRARATLARRGEIWAPRFFGRVATGRLTSSAMAGLLRRIPDGISELMTHPGYRDADLDSIRTRLRSARAMEVDVLRAPSTRSLMAGLGIALVRHDVFADAHQA
jgi:hopanoid biosynthesis associated protein HpnK